MNSKEMMQEAINSLRNKGIFSNDLSNQFLKEIEKVNCDENHDKIETLVNALHGAGCPQIVYNALSQVPEQNLRDMRSMIEDILIRKVVCEILDDQQED